MKRASFTLFAFVFLACGGDEPKPAQAPSTASTPPPTATTPPAPVVTAAPTASTPPAAPAADPSSIPQDKMASYLAVWKEYFAKENGITLDELEKRVAVKKTESAVRNYSRTFLEVTFD